MCGFFGSFSVEGKIDYSLKNLVSLSHRGPDSHKKYRDNFFFGEFFRLNIIGDEKANQPMISYDRNLIMLFNGEIYNYIELAEEYNISSKNGDSRVAIELFSKKGIEIIKKRIRSILKRTDSKCRTVEGAGCGPGNQARGQG